jgi:hypothetical protein
MKKKINWNLLLSIIVVVLIVATLVTVALLNISLSLKTLVLIGVIIFALAAIAWLSITVVKGGKINISEILDMVVNSIDAGEALAVALAPFAPGIPIAIIIKIADVVKKAVVQAEATYKVSLALQGETVDQRKVQATSLITSNLTLEGITIDDKISKLISVAIDLMCRALPKTHEAVVIAPAAVIQ